MKTGGEIEHRAREWEERPYGRRLVVDAGRSFVHTGETNLMRQLIVIDPQKDTATGYKSISHPLDSYGLRPHPGVVYEHVTHLGTPDTDDQGGDESLEYRFVTQEHGLQTQRFSKGSRFYSVQMDRDHTGWSHVLGNVHTKPIMLEIEVMTKH